MSKYEIIPPQRNQVAKQQPVSISPPTISAGGSIDAYFDRKQLERDTLLTTAMACKNEALSKYVQTRTQLQADMATYIRQVHGLMELPEILANELAVRRADRAERLREQAYQHTMAQFKRDTELREQADQQTLTQVRRDTDHTRAMVALVDAQQQLESQQQHGRIGYEINWKRRHYELLDLEMDAEAKRAVLREHQTGHRSATDEDTDAVLNDYRQQLAQNGLDTSRIDAILAERRR